MEERNKPNLSFILPLTSSQKDNNFVSERSASPLNSISKVYLETANNAKSPAGSLSSLGSSGGGAGGAAGTRRKMRAATAVARAVNHVGQQTMMTARHRGTIKEVTLPSIEAALNEF